MIKHIALVRAKPGMSRAAFINRYEAGHVPLVLKLVPYFKDYRRSFPIPDGMVSLPGRAGVAVAPDFDVVTELWFEDQARVDLLGRELARTDIGPLIAEDKAQLCDRARTIIFAANEFITPAKRLAPRLPHGHDYPAIKLIGTLRKKPGISRTDFIDCYETVHAPLALRLLTRNGMSLFAGYHRNYPVSDRLSEGPYGVQPRVDIGFDVMTELWFWTDADFRTFLALRGEPQISRELSAEAHSLFDRDSTSLFLTEEHICPRADIDAAFAARND